MKEYRRPSDTDIVSDEEIREQLKLYKREVEALPVISEEESDELLDRMRNGDEEARAPLIESKLRLVLTIAEKYRNRGQSILDLIMAGNDGLIKAIDEYQGSGDGLDKYAEHRIRCAILRDLFRVDTKLRIPAHKAAIHRSVIETARILLQKEGREPTDLEIAEESGLPVETVEEVMHWIRFDL